MYSNFLLLLALIGIPLNESLELLLRGHELMLMYNSKRYQHCEVFALSHKVFIWDYIVSIELMPIDIQKQVYTLFRLGHIKPP